MKVWEKVSLKSSLGLASLEGSERGDGRRMDRSSIVTKKLLVIDHAERVNYRKAGVRLLSFEVITNKLCPRP